MAARNMWHTCTVAKAIFILYTQQSVPPPFFLIIIMNILSVLREPANSLNEKDPAIRPCDEGRIIYMRAKGEMNRQPKVDTRKGEGMQRSPFDPWAHICK